MTFYYFAYGSNMLTTRLKPRCPGTVLVGRADADGFVVEFSKRSIDGSGKAALREDTGGRASGVLFEIPKAELGLLDSHEGLGSGYDRHDSFAVRRAGSGEIVQAKTYLATATDSSLTPYDWYLALVIAGARENGLGKTCLEALRRVAYSADPAGGKVNFDALTVEFLPL